MKRIALFLMLAVGCGTAESLEVVEGAAVLYAETLQASADELTAEVYFTEDAPLLSVRGPGDMEVSMVSREDDDATFDIIRTPTSVAVRLRWSGRPWHGDVKFQVRR